MKAKYKVGDVVLYSNKNSYQLGVVKLVIQNSPTPGVQQYNMFDEPIEDPNIFYQYNVQFSKDNRAHLIDEALLSPISNIKNFTVLKRSTDDSINDNACRQLACEICDRLDSLVCAKYGEPLFDDYTDTEDGDPTVEGLIGGAYNYIEDLITAALQGEQYE